MKFNYVQELQDDFLALFPHRYDYIWANYPTSLETPDWRTESRHPLGDRLIRQGAYLYGVRFGAETNYCLLDIDAGSLYHPHHDPFAVNRVIAALEPLGLVSYLACTSSYSGGLHLYLPFQEAQSSWQLAIAVSTVLENAGFRLIPGQLEVFPDPKPYRVEGRPALFNAHRLPMQIGSYLLGADFQPVWSDQRSFVEQWKFAQNHNQVSRVVLKQLLKQAKRQHFRISGKAEKFLNDLNTEIETGWTGYGQTNRLLGRITMRAYVFQHVLSEVEPLSGKQLVEEVVRTARSLPGYSEWCRHQHEIEHRAEEWVRCIESSHYFHYGDPQGKFKRRAKESVVDEAIAKAPTWNQQQAIATRDRIRGAIADLLEQGVLPVRATARFHALLSYGIGGGSLYRHRDLWHPNYLHDNYSSREASELDCVKDASNSLKPLSLLSDVAGNQASGNGSGDRTDLTLGTSGCNKLSDRVCAHSTFSVMPIDLPTDSPIDSLTDSSIDAHENLDANESLDQSLSSTVSPEDKARDPMQGPRYIQQILLDIRAWRAAQKEAMYSSVQQQPSIQQEALQAQHIARMQRFLDSDDPILVAEALAWARANPGGDRLIKDIRFY
jgi:hypothetical protein